MSPLNIIFEDNDLVVKIKNRLPRLFFLAEADASRAGKLGMEIGSVRERVIIALLMYKFGEKNVNSKIPIQESGKDVIVYHQPVSIKTISSRQIEGVKVFWTEDNYKIKEFIRNYEPHFDILLVHINWHHNGLFALIPVDAQQAIMNSITRERYLTQIAHHKGIEYSREALRRLLVHPFTRKIEIFWTRPIEKYDQYKNWLYYWME